MTSINITLNHGILNISGELSRYSIADIKESAYVDWFEHSAVKVDLNQVSKSDTAGLAWMLYLLEQSERYACQLSFCNIPEQLTKLITLSGVGELLPITGE